MKVTFAKGEFRVFKSRKPRRQREEPLSEAQAERLSALLAVARQQGAQSQAKPTAPRTALRQLVAPNTATVWRGSYDGRIVTKR